ncbi:T9SS type A sorting domain-containing protein [candidate division KSB1 bacterium]
MGLYVFQDDTTLIRNVYNNGKTYPDDYDQTPITPHDNSEIISGALWDFRVGRSSLADQHKADLAAYNTLADAGYLESFQELYDKFVEEAIEQNSGWETDAILAFANHGIPLAVPQNLSITNSTMGGDNPILSWSAASGASKYYIYRNDVLEDSTAAITFTDTEITICGTSNTYVYKVSMVTSNGEESAKSDEVLLITFEPPAPADFECTNPTGWNEAPVFTWARADYATEYRIYRKKNSGSFVCIDTTSNLTCTDWSVILSNEDPDTYYYKAKSANIDSVSSNYSDQETLTGFGQQKASSGAKIPKTFGLNQNFPNPFNPVTEIKYQLPKASSVTLTVYNMLGQEVARLVDTDMPAGYHSVKWDASSVASGTYIYKIAAGNFTAVKKMVVIK